MLSTSPFAVLRTTEDASCDLAIDHTVRLASGEDLKLEKAARWKELWPKFPSERPFIAPLRLSMHKASGMPKVTY